MRWKRYKAERLVEVTKVIYSFLIIADYIINHHSNESFVSRSFARSVIYNCNFVKALL
jgi:hypothetical protein